MTCEPREGLRFINAGGDIKTIANTFRLFTDLGSGSGVLAQLPLQLGSVSTRQSVAVDPTGNVVTAAAEDYQVRRITPTGVVTSLAGLWNGQSPTNGTGSVAQFLSFGRAIASDSAGVLYVSEEYGVRKVDTGGTVTLFAGVLGTASGAMDGPLGTARFSAIHGIAFGPDGALYVADQGNNAIRRVDSAGTVTTYAGALGQAGSADGTRTTARFQAPDALAFAPDGTLCVTDGTTLRTISADGSVVTSTAITATTLAFDPQGNLYFGDGASLWMRAAGSTTPVRLIQGFPNGGVTLGDRPALGPLYGIAFLGPKQLVLLSQGYLLKATLP